MPQRRGNTAPQRWCGEVAPMVADDERLARISAALCSYFGFRTNGGIRAFIMRLRYTQ